MSNRERGREGERDSRGPGGGGLTEGQHVGAAALRVGQVGDDGHEGAQHLREGGERESEKRRERERARWRASE